MLQTATDILLIKPANFAFNTETAVSNAFQHKLNTSREEIEQHVQQEFEAFVSALKAKNIGVHVFEDTPQVPKPDAIFPNNWVSFHPDGKVILYPMCTPNRRLERRMDIIETLKNEFEIEEIIDLSGYEQKEQFLEGTGSIVFDHINQIAYACLSPRTHPEPLATLCEQLQYQPVCFHAHDANGQAIYHTNVMMCVVAAFAVVCLDSITDRAERDQIVHLLKSTGHELIDISLEQMNQFAGNMLCLQNQQGENILALSASAFASLSSRQKQALGQYAELLPLSIPTIETIGGGSARCMMAELFLQKRDGK